MMSVVYCQVSTVIIAHEDYVVQLTTYGHNQSSNRFVEIIQEDSVCILKRLWRSTDHIIVIIGPPVAAKTELPVRNPVLRLSQSNVIGMLGNSNASATISSSVIRGNFSSTSFYTVFASASVKI